MFLIGICLWFFALFLAISPRKCLKKNSLLVRSCFFCLVLSVLGFGLTTSVCVVFSFFSFSFKRQSSGLTGHHTPPHLLLFFLFFPRRFVLFRLFWPCVLFVLVFLRGAILGPGRFLDSLGTVLRPFFLDAMRQRRLFVFWCVVFPVLRLHTFLVGLAPLLRKAGPAGGLARSPCPSEGRGSLALLGRRD